MKDFFDESFEGFLKRNADQLRMRPSENVWNNIEKNRNRYRRRVTIGSALFFLTASLFSYFSLNSGPTVSLKPLADRTGSNQPANTAVQDADNKSSVRTITELSSASVLTPNAVIRRNNPLRVASLRGVAPTQPGQSLQAEPTQTDATPFTIAPVDAYEPNGTAAIDAPESKMADEEEQPLSIESVVNSYKPQLRKKRVEFQLFFTPTISYRKLSENKSFLRSAPPGSLTNIAALYDVNNVVTHKPDLGLEIGFALKYPVTKSIKLKTGLQFNMNRYDIKVFNNVPEIATIALNSNTGRVNSLNTVTRYRNFSGAQSDWIQNTYYQISTPVGVEVKLSGDDKKQFGVATNIQPTYIIGDRAYLISTDYKNYSQVPWLIRNWNVNTSVEAFVAYSTGKLKWQVGPQVRYQLLSSFRSEYPVKENLFDFGFKVGVALNK